MRSSWSQSVFGTCALRQDLSVANNDDNAVGIDKISEHNLAASGENFADLRVGLDICTFFLVGNQKSPPKCQNPKCRGQQAGLESPENKPSQAGLAWLVLQQVLYITVGAMVESCVPLHYIRLSFSDDWFDNIK